MQDVTGVDKSARERLHLLADCAVGITYVFNDVATVGIFTVLNNYATLAASQVGRTTTIVFSGDTLTQELLYEDFPLTRAADGSLTGSTTGHISNGTLAAWA